MNTVKFLRKSANGCLCVCLHAGYEFPDFVGKRRKSGINENHFCGFSACLWSLINETVYRIGNVSRHLSNVMALLVTFLLDGF